MAKIPVSDSRSWKSTVTIQSHDEIDWLLVDYSSWGNLYYWINLHDSDALKLNATDGTNNYRSKILWSIVAKFMVRDSNN